MNPEISVKTADNRQRINAKTEHDIIAGYVEYYGEKPEGATLSILLNLQELMERSYEEGYDFAISSKPHRNYIRGSRITASVPPGMGNLVSMPRSGAISKEDLKTLICGYVDEIANFGIPVLREKYEVAKEVSSRGVLVRIKNPTNKGGAVSNTSTIQASVTAPFSRSENSERNPESPGVPFKSFGEGDEDLRDIYYNLLVRMMK